MSNLSIFCKSLACLTVFSSLVSPIYFYTSFPKPKTSITLGESGKGEAGLILKNMNNVNQLLKDAKPSKLTVEQAGITFQGRKLTSKDILINPCEDERYYPVWFVGGRDPYRQYQLFSGERIAVLRCRVHAHLYEKLNYVRLKWANPTNGRIGYLPVIWLSSCFFTKGGDSKIKITCNSGEWARELQGIFEVN